MFYFLMNRNIFHVFFNDVSEFYFTLKVLIKFTSVANQNANTDMLLNTENVIIKKISALKQLM